MKKILVIFSMLFVVFFSQISFAQTQKKITLSHGKVVTMEVLNDKNIRIPSSELKTLSPQDFAILILEAPLKGVETWKEQIHFEKLTDEYIKIQVPSGDLEQTRKIEHEIAMHMLAHGDKVIRLPSGKIVMWEGFNSWKPRIQPSELKKLSSQEFSDLLLVFQLGGLIEAESYEKINQQYIEVHIASADKNQIKSLENEIKARVQKELDEHRKVKAQEFLNILFDWAKEYKLTTTKNTAEMRLKETISREEVAALIHRAIMAKVLPAPKVVHTEKAFKDAHKIAPEFRDNISYLQKYGIFKGDANGNFRPKDRISVHEVKLLIARSYSDKKLPDSHSINMFNRDITNRITNLHKDDSESVYRQFVFESLRAISHMAK